MFYVKEFLLLPGGCKFFLPCCQHLFVLSFILFFFFNNSNLDWDKSWM